MLSLWQKHIQIILANNCKVSLLQNIQIKHILQSKTLSIKTKKKSKADNTASKSRKHSAKSKFNKNTANQFSDNKLRNTKLNANNCRNAEDWNVPSMLSKTENGESRSTKLRPFFWHFCSTKGVESTITTGVIWSINILPSVVLAGSAIVVSLENSNLRSLEVPMVLRGYGIKFELGIWPD